MLYFQSFWGLGLQLTIILFLSIIIFSNNYNKSETVVQRSVFLYLIALE